MDKDDSMEPISRIAAKTGVSRKTLSDWARKGKLIPAERRDTVFGPAWFTTVQAVEERVALHPPKVGRTVSRRKPTA